MLREGKFKADPLEWAVNNSANGLPQFVCTFGITDELQGDQWVDVSAEGMETTGYFNLIYVKDGAPVQNRINIESIEKSFGWTGRQMDVLNDTDWAGVKVQIVLEEQEYNGKTTVKVKYLNHVDYAGGNGVKKADPGVLRQMQQQFGAALMAGATPAAAKPRTVSNPGKAAPSEPTNPLQVAKAQAWGAFGRKHPDVKGEALADLWRKAIQDVFGQPANQLGAAQWRKFIEQDFEPLEDPTNTDGEQFTEDSIPF